MRINIKIKILVLSLLFVSCVKKYEIFNCKNCNLVFLGYYENKPIYFYIVKEGGFYLLNEKHEIIRNYPDGYYPQFVSNNNIYLSALIDGEYYICIDKKKGRDVFIETKDKALNIVVDSSNRFAYYSDHTFEKMYKLDIGTKKSQVINIPGYVVSLVNDNLYFIRVTIPEKVGPNYDLFRVSTKDFENIEKVAKNISSNGLLIFPNEKYITDMILKDGWFRPSIISIPENEYYFLPSFYEEYCSTPYYSNDSNCLVYYKNKTLEKKYVRKYR
jgi:hypothetical protein